MSTNKLTTKITKLWKNCRWILLLLISVVFVCGMCICLMVNSGIAQKLAEHSELVYIVNSAWFAVISFFSCKHLYEMGRRESKAKTTTSSKNSVKKEAKEG